MSLSWVVGRETVRPHHLRCRVKSGKSRLTGEAKLKSMTIDGAGAPTRRPSRGRGAVAIPAAPEIAIVFSLPDGAQTWHRRCALVGR